MKMKNENEKCKCKLKSKLLMTVKESPTRAIFSDFVYSLQRQGSSDKALKLGGVEKKLKFFFVYLPVLTFFFVTLCHEPPYNYPHTPLLFISHFSVKGGKKRISLAPVKEKYEDVENEA
jgi:hypothetical protein